MPSSHVNVGASATAKPTPLYLALVGLFLLGGLYVVFMMYATGQSWLALGVLLLVALAAYIYLVPKGYTYRYLFPGLLGMGLFVLFPLLYTVTIAYTNYSSSNLLSFERAEQYFLEETFQAEGAVPYKFSLLDDDGELRIGLESTDGELFVSDALNLDQPDPAVLAEQVAMPADALPGEPLKIRDVIQRRAALNQVRLSLPNGEIVSMTGLRAFAPVSRLYERQEDGSLLNRQTGGLLTPNPETGFFENEAGEGVSPGFRVAIGWANFTRLFGDKDIQGPFFRIFGWTVTFAGLSVLFTLVVGITLACLLNWEALRFRSIYRVLLFLPYAVPAFISILVFKGLFNANFGEINGVLEALFGLRPQWFSDPFLAKVMILIVNTWLGYPYIMLLCMGLLKSIPSDLYEASSIAGVGPLTNFTRITAPLIVKPLTPLLIASFAFNFNNFVLIALLTNGRPDFLGTKVPAGTTDILVSYTYRIAFEDSGQNFGLAAAISCVIFVMVAILSVIQLKTTKATGQAR